ncbi:MAG: ATP-binding protein [Gammaproteobacteria bacterium]|nr:ATP-binding protein [Gammaproteobacteria bacterium]
MAGPKKSGVKKSTPATRRSMSGAGFEFEDLISAWLLVKMLKGEQAPAIGGTGTQLQSQVLTLGWHIDDLLLTAQGNKGESKRLAISAKGNLQVSASGLPADFVNRAWEQWRDPQSPMIRSGDGLALVTLGVHAVFDPAWREVKNACTGSDVALTMSQIRSNPNQLRVFNRVQKPDQNGPAASDEETIELIRRLHVLPVDLQNPHSETKNQAIAQCRQILENGELTEAEKLWQKLVSIAADVRLRCGTITLQELWAGLRREFGLLQHPDYESDWETISSITSDYKARIETELPSGYSVPRTEEKSKLETAISTNSVTVVFGESGSGKSALVKNVLDGQLGGWTQVWFGPDELQTALSAARHGTLPLSHELARVLNATANQNNVLVIDSAERIDPADFGVIQQLLQAVLSPTEQVDGSAWRVVVITQTQSWAEGAEAILNEHQAALVELELLKNSDVKLALLASPSLGWLTGHDDTVAALTNLRTLAWVVKAGSALGSNSSGLTSHTSIADRLWSYWTGDRVDVKRLMMNLAKREASFERSFALTDLDSADATTLTPWPNKLPLHLNQRTNRIEYEHDLAADWARFQFLKQVWSDTAQWAALAENPLWTNALRMLGQHLLRQITEHGTAWDAAFEAAEGAELSLACDILLDALCLDPEAERFLTERVDLLLANNAKRFTRLLTRFHHIGTIPTGGILGMESSLGLYMEVQNRSIVIGRWFPVLRFLIAQRAKFSGQVSTAVAKVVQTWLTGTPRELGNETLVPFRRELAEMALAMVRTVQVKKGHGVMFPDREPLLYTAALAGAADLPDEIGTWALELAGRRKVADEVNKRIAEALRQQAEKHQEHLRIDPEYKARHEAKHHIPASIGSSRERLPPWPLGASHKVDMDFRDACFKGNGLQTLMHTRPDVAAEVLLALIIDDQPEREYGSSRHEIELGLDYAQDDGYPTAFWKSPFFSFFQIAPDAALKALIELVDFCTERWIEEFMDGREGSAPGLTLRIEEGEDKTFAGLYRVFDWTQTNSHHNGNLFCALDALERWLTLRLDAGIDVTSYMEQILREGTSTSFIGLLANVGKYRPSLFSGVLAPLLTDPYVFYWDNGRVNNISSKFDSFCWGRAGEVVFNIARDWTLAPHRKKALKDVVVDLFSIDTAVSERLQAMIPSWPLPENPKVALEFKLLFAVLDRDNYRSTIDPDTGDEVLTFACPDELSLEVQSWQDEHSKPLQYLLLPKHCEELLQAKQSVGDDDAAHLHNLLKECGADAAIDENSMTTCKVALAATLIVLADSWLAKTPEAKEDALSIIRKVVGEVASTAKEIQSKPFGHQGDELKFAAYAVMHHWITTDDPTLEWEASVLRLLTSGESRVAGTIVGIAYANRQHLGSAWWRLLQAGVLWSGLTLLAPHYGDGEDEERAWGVWLARLRHFPLRGEDATVDDLNMTRVAAGCERLDFYRRMRVFEAGDKLWRGKPVRRTGMGLDSHFLGFLFHWLINGPGTGDWSRDIKLVGLLWEYETGCASQRARKENGEYDLLSQNLGYGLLEKLGELALAAPEAEARDFWEPVLMHGPEAHYALQDFISGLFLRLAKGDNPNAFERVWREMAEYGLAAKWEKHRLWYYGERLICDLLGFGNEDALRQSAPGAALRMRDVYERWAEFHMGRDEDCIKRFCYFLTTEFGASLRFDGLRWIATMLKAHNPNGYRYRDGASDALIELVNTSLNQNAQALINDSQTRNALVEITAALAARNIPTALALQERIKRLR